MDAIARGRATRDSGRRLGGLRSRGLQERLLRVFLYAVLTSLAVIFLIPLVWVISNSLKLSAQVFIVPVQWIPPAPQWTNYVEIFTLVPLAQYGLNSLIVAVSATIGAVLCSSLVGFALCRLKWPGRNVVFTVVLATMMLPGVVTLVPTFVLMTNLGWQDTFWPLIVPSWLGGNAFYIFLMRQFLSGLPIELDEAARIDGAGTLRVLFQVILPLTKPALTTVAMFSFLDRYNDLLGPAMYLTSSKNFTLPIGLYFMAGTYGRFWAYVMAASVVVTIPVMVLFFLGQRQFIQGIQLSGLAGR